MKKCLFSILLSSVFLMNFVGCSNKNEINIHEYDNVTLQEYLDTHVLPNNLTVSFDCQTVKEPSSVKIYTGTYWDFDHAILNEVFLSNQITKKEILAYSVLYWSEQEEFIKKLTINDGGKAYGAENFPDQLGSFHYYSTPDYKFEKFNPVDFVDNIYQFSANLNSDDSLRLDTLNAQYQHYSNLTFAPYEDAISTSTDLIQKLKLPTLELFDLVSVDYKNMLQVYKDHKNLVWAPDEEIPEEEIPYLPQKEDEFYLLQYRQKIDNIPINYLWLNKREGYTTRETYATIVYSKDGIIECDMQWLVNPQTGTKKTIINASNAFDILLQKYQKSVLLNQHNVKSFELVYIIFSNPEKKELILKPYWFAQVSHLVDTEIYWADGTVEKKPVEEMDYTLINAENGKILDTITEKESYITK